MLRSSPPTLRPGVFLGRFPLAMGLLCLVWVWVSPWYAASLVPPANGLLTLQGLPIHFEARGSLLLLACQGPDGAVRRSQFTGHQLLFVSALVAMALSAAAPGCSWRRRLGCAGGLGLAMWLANLLSLWAGGYCAAEHYLNGLPAQAQQALRAHGWAAFTRERAEWLSGLVGWWSALGSPALLLLGWVGVTARALGLAEPDGEMPRTGTRQRRPENRTAMAGGPGFSDPACPTLPGRSPRIRRTRRERSALRQGRLDSTQQDPFGRHAAPADQRPGAGANAG